MEKWDFNLPLNQQVGVWAAFLGEKEPVALASAMLCERWKESQIEDPEIPGQFSLAEGDPWGATDPVTIFLPESLKELPGCLA